MDDGVNDLEFYLGCRSITSGGSKINVGYSAKYEFSGYTVLDNEDWNTAILAIQGDEPPITHSMKQMKLRLDPWNRDNRKIY
jgi:hypothetical protein